jgi:hypothetical protein
MQLLKIMLGYEGREEAPKAKKLVKWLAWLGVALILSGLSSYVGNVAWYRTRTWYPLDVPIVLTVGHVGTPEFTVNLRESFEIQLDVDRQVPKLLMDNVLGTGDLLSSKPDEVRGFKLAWTLSSDGKVVKHEISDGHNQGYWGSRTGRLLGFFRAEKGKRYRVDVDVLEDGSQLAAYHPRLKVCVDLFTLDGYAMGEGITELALLAVAGFGAALLVSAMILHWRAVTRHSALPVS